MTAGQARRSGPGRPRDPEADTAILRAAVELLMERGIDQCGIERIAKRAGVTKVTVYRRWRTKEELLAQAIETVRDEMPAVVVELGPDTPLPDAIELLLPRWGEILANGRFRALSAHLLAAGPSHPALLRAYRTHHVLPRRERARATMRRAQADGYLDPTADVDLLIDMMEGAVIHQLLLNPEPPGPAETTRYLRALLVQVGFVLRPAP
ncbi:TetR family transcriptional regulator [Murinocardiopsis flavida]|uniref:TetR family transcriptional regulator n=1 Tax=Murinocardiopsis flavida TaxID=645275 RepID=A0A2P8DNR6_9ACTN|nr:TetR/AcrR family transcriptional regulator [Murinocardiopsis flavida]PSK98854.1 TetR family transcriptional regulator [Murinocardiopsis flavida]